MQHGAEVSTVVSQQEEPGFESWLEHFCVEFACLSWRLLSGYSNFLHLSKDMHARLTGDSKLAVGMNVSLCPITARIHSRS